MRWGRGAIVAAGCAAALVGATGSQALLDYQIVHVTPDGLVPRVVHGIAPITAVAWINDGGSGTATVFADGSCRVAVASSDSSFSACRFRVGRHPYTIAGQPPGADSGVVVTAPGQRSVSISASRRVVTYGEAVMLTGVVDQQTSPPSFEIREPVAVVGVERGRGRRVASAVSGAKDPAGHADGWSAELRPGVSTAYHAELLAHLDVWARVKSPEMTVAVRPRVVLRRVSAKLEVAVAPAAAFAGRTVRLQRLVAGRWLSERRAALTPRGTATFPASPGRVRAFVYASPGYLAGASAPLETS